MEVEIKMKYRKIIKLVANKELLQTFHGHDRSINDK